MNEKYLHICQWDYRYKLDSNFMCNLENDVMKNISGPIQKSM